MRNAILWLAPVLLIVSVAGAQNDGDVVLTVWSSTTTHLLAATPGGLVSTIMSRPNTNNADGLAAAPANDGGLMVESTRSPTGLHVLKFQNASSVSTLATLPTTFTRVPTLLVDQGGDILLLSAFGTDQGVYRMPARGGPLMTIAHNTLNANFTAPFAMAEEPVSGDIVVLDLGRKLHRIDRTGTVTTLTMVLPPSTAIAVTGNVHVDYGSGLMFLTYANFFMGLDPNTGAVTTIFGTSTTNRNIHYGLDGDPFGVGLYLSAYHTTPTPTGYFVMRYNPRNGLLSTVATLPTGTLGDVVTWRSRMLGGLSRPLRGTPYQVRLTIPSEATKGYFAAASLGTIPGIPVGGGRVVPLNPDVFFFLSIQVPLIFSNFQGVLSANGTATLTVNIPGVAQLLGFRFFLGAITFDGGGIRAITEPLGVTIE